MQLGPTLRLPLRIGLGLLALMTRDVSRRAVLAGLLAGTGQAAFANAPTSSLVPRPRPSEAEIEITGDDIVREAGLGGNVSFALIDVQTRRILERRDADRLLPPASTAKVPTAQFAIAALGRNYRFPTRLLASGPIEGGTLKGDLILRGSGDPTLNSDHLAALVSDLKDLGVVEVEGRFFIDDRALPRVPFIDDNQPDHVAYNPSVSGLNLNQNRVHFEWKRSGNEYTTTMQARSRRVRPEVGVATMSIQDRGAPVFEYSETGAAEEWSVARSALGRDGARWLPVRRPDAYVDDVFRTLARSNGIVLTPGEGPPPPGVVIAEHDSAELSEIVRGMLKFSTNITAEALGLAASGAIGPRPGSLRESAQRMGGWLRSANGLVNPGFVDHSGLGYASRVSALDMARTMAASPDLIPLLDQERVGDNGATVPAKTGTLNFVSSLAGFVTPPGGRVLAFAILTADSERRDAIPRENRERPPGARSWANRSRRLQRELVTTWTQKYRA